MCQDFGVVPNPTKRLELRRAHDLAITHIVLTWALFLPLIAGIAWVPEAGGWIQLGFTILSLGLSFTLFRSSKMQLGVAHGGQGVNSAQVVLAWLVMCFAFAGASTAQASVDECEADEARRGYNRGGGGNYNAPYDPNEPYRPAVYYQPCYISAYYTAGTIILNGTLVPLLQFIQSILATVEQGRMLTHVGNERMRYQQQPQQGGAFVMNVVNSAPMMSPPMMGAPMVRVPSAAYIPYGGAPMQQAQHGVAQQPMFMPGPTHMNTGYGQPAPQWMQQQQQQQQPPYYATNAPSQPGNYNYGVMGGTAGVGQPQPYAMQQPQPYSMPSAQSSGMPYPTYGNSDAGQPGNMQSGGNSSNYVPNAGQVGGVAGDEPLPVYKQ